MYFLFICIDGILTMLSIFFYDFIFICFLVQCVNVTTAKVLCFLKYKYKCNMYRSSNVSIVPTIDVVRLGIFFFICTPEVLCIYF